MRRTAIACWLFAGGIAGATLLGLLDRVGLQGWPGWVFDLLAHWPRQLFVVAFVIALAAGAMRLLRPAGLAAVAAAINAAIVLNTTGFALPRPAAPGDRLVRVVSANVHQSRDALEKLAVMARDYRADVVSIYEMPDDLKDDAVSTLFPGMPLRLMPSETPEGLWLFKRSLIMARAGATDQVAVTHFNDSNGVILRLPFDGVRLVTAHPPSPGSPHLAFDRNRQLQQIGEGLNTAQPFIVMGDLNTTPWGRIYDAVPGTRAGDPRFEGTFPAFAGPLGLPIDHIKFGGGLNLTDYSVGPDIGSDHRPLFATFAIPDN
jgi:endonuclease/exonuclease/phosphatase (EEP) superfamily protein YafD